MNKKIKNILKSIDDIKQVEIKPYFYNRLSAKLEEINHTETFYIKYERPFLVMLVSILLAINLFFVSNNDSENSKSFSADFNEVYFEPNKNDIINFTSNED